MQKLVLVQHRRKELITPCYFISRMASGVQQRGGRNQNRAERFRITHSISQVFVI